MTSPSRCLDGHPGRFAGKGTNYLDCFLQELLDLLPTVSAYFLSDCQGCERYSTFYFRWHRLQAHPYPSAHALFLRHTPSTYRCDALGAALPGRSARDLGTYRFPKGPPIMLTSHPLCRRSSPNITSAGLMDISLDILVGHPSGSCFLEPP